MLFLRRRESIRKTDGVFRGNWKHRPHPDHQPLHENKHCFLTAFHLMWDSSPAFSQWAHHTEVIIWKRRKEKQSEAETDWTVLFVLTLPAHTRFVNLPFFFLFPSQILFLLILFFAFLAPFPAFTVLCNSLEPRLVSLYLASFIPTLVLSHRFLNIFQSFPLSSGCFLTNFHSLARFQWKGSCHEAILKERKQGEKAKLC